MSSVVITGGEGALAQALQKQFVSADHFVNAPGRDRLNVADNKSVATYFSSLSQIDILINNAGSIRDEILLRMTPDQWDEVLNVHLRGSFLCTQAALKGMLKQKRGHVIFIGSHAGLSGTYGQSNYAAAKAGLIGLAQSLAREYGSRNIQFNVVMPGYMETTLNQHLDDKIVSQIRDDHTLKRFNTVENATKFIAFLAQLDHVSGQVFNLDSRITPWT